MIDYQGVSLAYPGGQLVLKDLNLQIEEGEFFVLIGPSGSGKTTTLKLLNRLIEQTQGDIYFQGKRLKDYPLRQLRLQMGYVLQQIALFPNLSVEENIGLIPEMKGMDKQDILTRTRELLQKVGLDPQVYAQRMPSDLSGGERQRVGILRALAGQPRVLLMDEPFSALDPISRGQLQDLTGQLHRDFKMTTVFVTHDLDEAMKLGDRIGLMHEGNLVQVGRPQDLINHPANDYVAQFMKSGGIG